MKVWQILHIWYMGTPIMDSSEGCLLCHQRDLAQQCMFSTDSKQFWSTANDFLLIVNNIQGLYNNVRRLSQKGIKIKLMLVAVQIFPTHTCDRVLQNASAAGKLLWCSGSLTCGVVGNSQNTCARGKNESLMVGELFCANSLKLHSSAPNPNAIMSASWNHANDNPDHHKCCEIQNRSVPAEL